MTLYLIGLGLNDEKDISLRGLETVKRCKYIYFENYTSLLQCSKETLEKLYGHKIIDADREQVENKSKEILAHAKEADTALLVIGDPMAATTHISLFMEAKEKNIPVKVIHNASVISAVGVTGLQLYKFGKTTSIPFTSEEKDIETYYDVIKENLKNNMHTLVLLDLNPKENQFMTVNRAIEVLSKAEAQKKEGILTEKTVIVGISRLGSDEQLIKPGTKDELQKADFGKPPHCMVIPARKLHFMEEEALQMWTK